MRSNELLVVTALLAGCAAGCGARATSLGRRPAVPIVDTEARAVVSEKPTARPPAPAASQAVQAAPRAASADPERTDGDTKDPFNSQSVDENREGSYIIERVLTFPEPDPPRD